MLRRPGLVEPQLHPEGASQRETHQLPRQRPLRGHQPAAPVQSLSPCCFCLPLQHLCPPAGGSLMILTLCGLMPPCLRAGWAPSIGAKPGGPAAGGPHCSIGQGSPQSRVWPRLSTVQPSYSCFHILAPGGCDQLGPGPCWEEAGPGPSAWGRRVQSAGGQSSRGSVNAHKSPLSLGSTRDPPRAPARSFTPWPASARSSLLPVLLLARPRHSNSSPPACGAAPAWAAQPHAASLVPTVFWPVAPWRSAQGGVSSRPSQPQVLGQEGG